MAPYAGFNYTYTTPTSRVAFPGSKWTATVYDVQKRVIDYLKENELGSELANSRGEIRLEDLPEELANDIRSTQRRYREELDAMESDPYGLQFQLMLQADSHVERLEVFGRVLDMERKRRKAEELENKFKAETNKKRRRKLKKKPEQVAEKKELDERNRKLTEMHLFRVHGIMCAGERRSEFSSNIGRVD